MARSQKHFFTACDLLIKINGTGKIVPFLPHEIITDGSFLEQFSTKDICTILSIYYEVQRKVRYKIVSQKFSSDGKKIFCLKETISNKIQEMSLADIIANQEIVKHCSPEDAFIIGYHSGKEQKKLI